MMFCRSFLLFPVILLLFTTASRSNDTVFTYQGDLKENGDVANGTYNLDFSLWDAASAGNQIGTTISMAGVSINDGRFTVELDFGGAAFDNNPRWLEVVVNGNILAPRQPVSRAPYAIQTRGIHVNSDETFVGIGRQDQIFPTEVFGISSNSNGFGGMYAETNDGGQPYYGYATNGSVDAYHYYDDSTGTWRLWAGTERISVNRSDGKVGIGTVDPQAKLHIVPTSAVESPLHVEDANGNQCLDVSWNGNVFLGRYSEICGLSIGASAVPEAILKLGYKTPIYAGPFLHVYQDKNIFWNPVLVGRTDPITTAEEFGVHSPAGDDEYGGMYVSTTSGNARPFYGYAAGENPDMWTYYDGATGDWHVHNGLDDWLTVESSGQVGINETNPSYTLEVNGSAGKPGGGSWSNSSDRRLKKNIEQLDGALERLLELRGVSFEYIDPASINELDGQRIGVIGQEVENVFPDWVDERDDGYKSVTFRGFEALTVEALREIHNDQESKFKRQQSQIALLQQDNAALRAQLEQLETVLLELQTK